VLKKGKQLLLLIRHSTCLLLQNVCSFHNTIIKDFLYLILMCTKNVIFRPQGLLYTCSSQIISCSGDGKIYYTKVGREDQHEASLFDCHFGTTYEVSDLY
jgi:hypothetical protein